MLVGIPLSVTKNHPSVELWVEAYILYIRVTVCFPEDLSFPINVNNLRGFFSMRLRVKVVLLYS